MTTDENKPSPDDSELPVFDLEIVDPWSLPDPGPTTLLAAVATEQPPTMVEVHSRIASIVNPPVEILGEPEVSMPAALWSLAFKLGEHPVPVVVWVEDVIENPEGQPAFAQDARWMVGIQTVLDPNDPLPTWTGLITLLQDITGGMVALLDVETEQWFDGAEVAAHLQGEEATAEEGMLFRVHATSTDEQPETAQSVWLHTVGLMRCGRTELEMLEVPGQHVQTAHELLKALGALFIVRGIPGPGENFDAGIGINLCLQDWSSQAETLSPDSIGKREHRVLLGGSDSSENPLLHGRAVVCGAEPRGDLRKIYTWPVDAITRLERGEAAIERTRAWTVARSREAQARWPVLLEGMREGLVGRACIAVEVPGGGREHVWITIDDATETLLSGRLLSAPASLPYEPGSVLESTVDQLIDWALTREESE